MRTLFELKKGTEIIGGSRFLSEKHAIIALLEMKDLQSGIYSLKENNKFVTSFEKGLIVKNLSNNVHEQNLEISFVECCRKITITKFSKDMSCTIRDSLNEDTVYGIFGFKNCDDFITKLENVN